MPPDWERLEAPTTLQFAPKHQEPNSENARMILVQVKPCENLPEVTSESDLPTVQSDLKEIMGMMHLRGASVNDPYLGHKGSTTPFSLTIPGHLLEPPRAKDFVFNLMVHEIYDERNGRCIELMYPDSEIGRKLSSTLNITSPSP
jgi:hypothetical protein